MARLGTFILVAIAGFPGHRASSIYNFLDLGREATYNDQSCTHVPLGDTKGSEDFALGKYGILFVSQGDLMTVSAVVCALPA